MEEAGNPWLSHMRVTKRGLSIMKENQNRLLLQTRLSPLFHVPSERQDSYTENRQVQHSQNFTATLPQVLH